ncbi:MAG: ABC transporter permease, partial [Pyrinomonadaceae bacterium]
VIVGQRLWQRLLDVDPNILNRVITLDDKPYTVVGVMPNTFNFPIGREPVELWVPLTFTTNESNNRAYRAFRVIARLKPNRPNVSLEEEQMQINSIAQRLEQLYPNTNKNMGGAKLVRLREDLTGDVRPALLILLGAVAFVLAIACANIANLLLARGVSRGREIAIRIALGASRGRIIRQIITESVLLSLLGGAVGLLFTRLSMGLLLTISTDYIPRAHEIRIDGWVLAFTLVISVLTGLIFGLFPALQSSKSDLNESLKEGGYGHSAGAKQNRIRRLLVISEIALSLVLLIGAGLLINSFIRMLEVNLGFQPQNVLTMQISLTRSRYPTDVHVRRYFQEVEEKIAAAPGVESVSATTQLPLSQSSMGVDFSIEGRPQKLGEQLTINLRLITPNYFHTMGIPFHIGRDFSIRDNDDASKVVIINQSMARRYFPNQDSIGKRISVSIGGPVAREIIGVVGEVRHSGLNKESGPEVYMPYFQVAFFPNMDLVIRTTGDPLSFAPTARALALAVDKNQPVTRIKTMEQYISESVAKPRFNMILLVVFAILAMIMAATGIYGVMSYSVTQRTHEI